LFSKILEVKVKSEIKKTKASILKYVLEILKECNLKKNSNIKKN
jgi:hypothetical protein